MTVYPPLSQLIAREALPSDLGPFGGANETVEQLLDQLLAGVGFTDLVINQSAGGDVKFYALKIVAREFGFKLPGTDISFLFFPGETGSGAANIPIALDWRWLIKRHIRDFEMALFSRSPRDFLRILLSIADLTEAQFIGGVVTALVDDPDPYVKLVQEVEAHVLDFKNGVATIEDEEGELLANVDDLLTGIGALLADLQSATPAFDSAAQHISDTFEEIATTLDVDLDVCPLVFESLTRTLSNPGEKLQRLRDLFMTWFGGFGWDDVEQLLIPQFDLTITQLPVALEFPRKWLIPLNPDGSEKPEPAASQLTFNAGSVRYSTRTGLTFTGENSFAFPKSAIGKTGMTLAIENAKVDFSRTTNIAEADAAGYPVDFVGVYVEFIEIGLPPKWFAKHVDPNNPATLGVVGREMLIGTGGISGTIGLEVLAAGGTLLPIKTPPPPATGTSPPPELKFVLGKAPGTGEDRKGYIVGFSAFDMKFRQNRLLESRIKGSLTLPGFDPADPQGNRIDIALFLDNDGDFEVTASIAGGRKLKVPKVFSFNLLSASIGKDDRGVFVRCSGDLSFEENDILKTLIKQPIHLEKLMVHSDGTITLEGGKVPLPKAVVLPIGPAKISITAIGFGALEQERGGVMRRYRYVMFDGRVSANPGAIGGSGDGICFCYTVDGGPFHSFLRIDGIGIKLMIPGTATPESAMLLLEGYLSLKEPEYAGSLKFGLPKLKIFGGASMRYNTRVPAWLVRVDLELPKALPLGSTGLGAYSFSGMFGLRFMAAKQAIGLPPEASWGDYYRGPPQRGIVPKKFLTPDKTSGSRNPFSVGVGVGLCTASDNGKVFSAQLFLLVSLPNLIMLEGAGDVLADKRVSITDDPPYYAYIALSPGESIELGVGVNYLVPKDSGKVLNLTAVLEAAFFFRNASAWYVNFGTKAKPARADILGLFNGYAYLMLSAAGIETGAGVSFDFNKRYGPIAIDAHAYLDFWAYIAFERFQAGGGIAMGGYLDIKCCGFGFNISLAATLSVEAPKPFYVAGSVEVCVSVKILKKKITKCCELSFRWEGNDPQNKSPVPVLTIAGPPAASAVHMVSGSTYEVLFSASPDLPSNAPPLEPIPIDSFIDVKLTKPVDPSAATQIGGYTSSAVGATETMPPRYGTHILEHRYALEKVRLHVRENGAWVDYHPYEALAPEGVLDASVMAALKNMPLGFWQKQEQGYSQIRFLALTPFSWMGPMVGHRPEELGVTPQSTYCVGRMRERRCVRWTEAKSHYPGLDYLRGGILYRVDGDRMEAAAFSEPRLKPFSLWIGPSGRASFQFVEPAAHCSIDLVTTAPWVKLHWQRRKSMTVAGPAVSLPSGPPEFEDAGPPTLVQRSDLTGPITYDQPGAPIDRVWIETPLPDPARIAELEEAIAQAEDSWMFLPDQRAAIERQLVELRAALKAEHDRTCVAGGATGPSPEALAELASLYEELKETLELLQGPNGLLQDRFDDFCAKLGLHRPRPDKPGTKREPPNLSAQEACALAQAVKDAEAHLQEIVAAIDALNQQGGGQGSGGRLCGTFVREICWLSQKDHAYNQSLPGIDAIAADFSRMRDALEGTIAPVWRPGEDYRIQLTVSDTVAGTRHPSDFYVHFRTEGPIGHFPVRPPPPRHPDDPPQPQQATDDERQEVPERSLRFYVDKQRSSPDPSGNLSYAKPTYTKNVRIRLFFEKPHAFHFFADWPGNGRKYALELVVKDPAEASPGSANLLEPHQTAIIDAPHLGSQSWQDDPEPQIPLEIRTLEAFRNPANPPDAAGNSLVCLSEGGEPVVPLARYLLVEIPELDPDKLYTAVALNRRTDQAATAEVLNYGFKTSLFADFPAHIASHRLEDKDGAARLAVFDIDHQLPGTEAQIVAEALAIVAGGPVADRAAWPDPLDGLVYGLLDLPPLPRAPTVEFNFVTAAGGSTFGLLIRGPEPLYDPRWPAATLASAIELLENGAPRAAHVLMSRDRSQAFVMVATGAFPTQNVAVRFSNLDWQGVPASPASVDSDAFSKS